MPGGKKGGGKGKKASGSNSRITSTIEAFSWNADHSQLALGIEKSIVIYKADTEDKKSWSKLHVIENAHGLDISALDWSPVTNKIVSSAHDRNAYVWTLNEENEWKPALVILHISRAALCAKWSPNGKKFAVGSGDRSVPVCQFDKEHNWWNPKGTINKKRGSSIQHKSSVVSVAWHPNSQFLATACADKKCRLYCAYVENLDGDLQVGPLGEFVDEDLEFGDPIFEFVANGWVHDVAFAPSGNKLCFVAHDSTVTVCNFEAPSDGSCLQTVAPWKGLPFNTCLFKTEDQIIVAGHGFFPLRVNGQDDEWTYGEPVDTMEAKKEKGGSSAMAKFKNRDTLGQDSKVEALKTKHQAPIRTMHLYKNLLTTGGSDGRLQFWNL